MMYYLAYVSEIAAIKAIMGLISTVMIILMKGAQTKCLTQGTYSAHGKPAVLMATMPAPQCPSIN